MTRPTARLRTLLNVVTLLLAGAAPAGAEAVATPDIHFDGRRFSPAQVAIPAGQPTMLRVTNDSGVTIEFESFALHREKLVTPGNTGLVRLPPLDPGHYDFFDDFHAEVPKGIITVQ